MLIAAKLDSGAATGPASPLGVEGARFRFGSELCRTLSRFGLKSITSVLAFTSAADEFRPQKCSRSLFVLPCFSMVGNEHISVEERTPDIRQIIDSSPALLHTARPDGYLDFFNQAWLDFAGRPLQDLLGWGWTSCIHPDDVKTLVQKLRQSFGKGEPFQERARVRRADGVYRWMLHMKVPLRNVDGNIIKWLGSSIDIEERKRAEEELQTSAQLLQRNEFYLTEAQRLGHIGSWVFDPAGRFAYWSRELFHIYGLNPAKDAPNLEEYLACVHPHDREFMASLIRQMLAENLGCDITKRIVRPDGEIRHIRCVGVPVVENGTLKRILGSAIDVTEHETLTQELRRREAYLAEAQTLSHTGSFGWRPDSGEIVWSEETYRIFEHDPTTTVSFNMIMERVHPEDRSLVLEKMEWASSGGTIDFEHRLHFSDGRVKYVRVLARPLEIASDGLELAGAVIDITEAKRAEERIRLSEKELRSIVETIPAFVGTALPGGSVDFVSQSWLDYTGLSREQWLGWGWMSVIHPEDLNRGVANWRAALAKGTSVEQELRYRHADGTYHWFLNSNFPLRDDKGKIVKWYGIMFDIDDRKRAEDHLRDTRIKLSNVSRIATVAELSASIAHELNQPLMAVLTNAQAAKRWLAHNPPNLAETNASIDRILRDARGADETMQQIRALFKRESYNKKQASIPEIMGEAVRLVQEDPSKRDIPIEWHFDEHVPTISVDPIQIQHVFINLISNAIEATEKGRTAHPPIIKVRAAATDQDEVLIQVIDNGPGVDDPERIFDAFVTTKEKGMGIGLAVSRSIVEAHAGRLWAENNATGGATFNIALPLYVVSEEVVGAGSQDGR